MRHKLAFVVATAALLVGITASASGFGFFTIWGKHGTALGDLQTPWNIAVSPQPDNRVFVVDQHNHRIQRFAADGSQPFVFPAQAGGYGQGDGQLYYPHGIAVADGFVYVADAGNNRMQVFTVEGAFVRKWGTEGVGNNELNHPAGVAVNPEPNGNVYVADTRNHRVQVFTREGTYVRTIGEPGTEDGHFVVPTGVAVHRGRLFVSDEQQAKIQVFDLNGAFQGKLDYNVPKFIDQLAVDYKNDFLFAVAPLFPGQLLRFRLDGNNIGTSGGPTDVHTAESMHTPSFNAHGVAVNSDGGVYLADTEGDRIMALADCSQPVPAGISRAHAAAINEVRVVAVQPDVQFHRAGAPEDDWCQVEKDTVLKQGDEISADPDGAVTLQFADNSTVVVKNTTQLKIASFFTEGGVVRTEILLKMGEVAAKVNKSEATKSDFRIKSPTCVASVRGTTFLMSYDPGGKASRTAVTEGKVKVDPAKPGLKTVTVKAGREVEVTRKKITKPAKIGKAGARGGINRTTARDRVLAVIAAADACGVTTPRTNAYSVTPAKKGWKVVVKLMKGTETATAKSTWKVIRGKVKPTNALAKLVARNCAA
jgi:hypothetical protein